MRDQLTVDSSDSDHCGRSNSEPLGTVRTDDGRTDDRPSDNGLWYEPLDRRDTRGRRGRERTARRRSRERKTMEAHNVMLGTTRFLGAAMTAGLFLLGAEHAAATPLVCDVVTADECQITTLHDLGAGGPVEVDRTLHIFGPGGELWTNPGSTLALNITGGLTIDAGGKITGNAAAGNSTGATINITATGAVLLGGDGVSGGVISADQLGGSCVGGGAGNISIRTTRVGKASIKTQPGSRISADARCTAGDIEIAATRGSIVINGVVESVSTLSGTGGTQRPGGGPITISASCNLTIQSSGRVSSRGKDPGADLVHLEAGDDVVVLGVVESTGPGHAVPNQAANYCSGQKRPDKPADSTACVEIWAGGNLVID